MSGLTRRFQVSSIRAPLPGSGAEWYAVLRMSASSAIEPVQARTPRLRFLLWQVGTLVALSICLGSKPSRALLWPSETVRIERDLSAIDPAIRRRAALKLRELPQKAAMRVLVRALTDGDLQVRLIALDAAKELRLPGLPDRVLGWLTEAEPRLRLAAAELCATEPSLRAVTPLSRALSDVDPGVRAAAATALGASGAPEAVIGLLGRLDDATLEVTENVIRALARLADNRAVVPLVSRIEDPRPAIRRAVAGALGELGDRRAASALVLTLRDPDPTVRARALEALGELGDPSVTPSVSALLSQETVPSVRLSAIEALGLLGTSEAIAKLVDALGDSPEERQVLVQAISRAGSRAVPALIRCVSSSSERARADGCALALARSAQAGGGAPILDAVRRGRVSPAVALQGFSELGDSNGIPLALEHLSHRDSAVRQAALAAAKVLLNPDRADGRAVEPLELAFQTAENHRQERIELLALLGRTGSPRATRLLLPIAATAEDLGYRRAAFAALGSIREASVKAVLLDGLNDPEPSVRLAAALAIRKSAPRASLGELVDRFERAGSQDRGILALALPGVMADAPASVVERVSSAAFRSRGGERDALIEALAHARTPLAHSRLVAFSKSLDPADRAKAAEGMAFGLFDRGALVALSADKDPDVRANAVWVLGAVGTTAERALLLRALEDSDVAVRANAAAALGRLSARLGSSAVRELCPLLRDRLAAVRASALAALRLGGVRCDATARALLATDPSARVRRAAAELLRDTKPDEADAKSLRRCASLESTGSVAAACEQSRMTGAIGDSEVLVFVVPAGASAPVERAPFALRRPDFLVRHGRADRRGAVCEASVTNGELELDVPASFEE